MNRANVPDLRNAIGVAHTFMKAGILFVPVPVLDEPDHLMLQAMVHERMDLLIAEAEK